MFAFRYLLVLIGIVGTFASSVIPSHEAFAQTAVCTPLSQADLRAGLDQVEAAMRRTALEKSMEASVALYDALECASEIIDPKDLARLARLRCEIAFWDQDEEQAISWCAFARTVHNLPWPSRLQEGHPLRSAAEETEQPPIGEIPNKSLVISNGGLFLLDGRPAWEAKAYSEIPHFIQIVDKKQTVLLSKWIDGAAFPDDKLGPKLSGSPKIPKWFTAPAPAPAWGAPQSTLTEEQEKNIVEDRSNEKEGTDDKDDKDFSLDNKDPLHHGPQYLPPEDTEYGQLMVTVLDAKQKAVRTHVKIDGIKMGKTPWQGKLVAGAHFVDVMDKTQDVLVEKDKLTEALIRVEKGNAKLGLPLLIAGLGTSAIGWGGVGFSVARANQLEWNDPKNELGSLKAINGTGWALAGIGVGITGFGVIQFFRERSVSVGAGIGSVRIQGKW